MPLSDGNRGLAARWPRGRCGRIAVLALAAAVSAVGASPRPPRPTPAVHEDSAPRVVGIYPSGQRLPANLLRMYIVFSASMSTGESRTRLRLVDGAGRTIDRAFLALDEELWDPSGRRLTGPFDPGRIKRGLRANLEMGPPLVEGRRYSLVVDAGWRDADGRPLAEQHVKTFAAIAPRRASPDPGRWSILPPEGRTRTPLVVHFDEPLDRALLFTSVAVVDERGDPVHGIIEVGAGEGEWCSHPGSPGSQAAIGCGCRRSSRMRRATVSSGCSTLSCRQAAQPHPTRRRCPRVNSWSPGNDCLPRLSPGRVHPRGESLDQFVPPRSHPPSRIESLYSAQAMNLATVRQQFAAALDALIAQVRQDPSVLAAILCGSLSHDTVWASPTSTGAHHGGRQAGRGRKPRALRRRRQRPRHPDAARGVPQHGRRVDSQLVHALAAGEGPAALHPRRDDRRPLRAAARDRRSRYAAPVLAPRPARCRPIDKAHKWFVTRGDLDYTALWILSPRHRWRGSR